MGISLCNCNNKVAEVGVSYWEGWEGWFW